MHGTVTSEFGPRWGEFHPGIDIAAPDRTPIRASKAGVVIFAGWYGGYGNLVVVSHGGGLSTAYAHQSSIAVSQGQNVSQGQVLGYEGSTGYSTGPHLHFEVRLDGVPQNPRGYVPGNP
jgi:murein DD-endopeptidase MepM/ murein hydrolase activator NlpD